jgi:hypothetical protein
MNDLKQYQDAKSEPPVPALLGLFGHTLVAAHGSEDPPVIEYDFQIIREIPGGLGRESGADPRRVSKAVIKLDELGIIKR